MKCYRILDSTFNGTQLDSGIPLQAYSTSTELQNPRTGIPPDSGTPDSGFHRTLEAEFHLSGIPPDSKAPDLVFHRIPEFRLVEPGIPPDSTRPSSSLTNILIHLYSPFHSLTFKFSLKTTKSKRTFTPHYQKSWTFRARVE